MNRTTAMLPSHRLRHRGATVLAALAIMASACGSDSGVLQGDVAAQTNDPAASAPVTSEPLAASAPDSVPETPEATDDAGPSALAEVNTGADEQEDAASTEQAEPGIRTVVSAQGGATDTFTDTRFTIRSVESTNSDLPRYIRAEPALDCCDRNYVVVHTTIENLIHRFWFMSRTDLVLESPTGDRYVAAHTYDEVDERHSTISFGGRDAVDLRIVFETESFVEDLSDWHLIVRGVGIDTDRLPLVLPLDGAGYARNYPLALSDGARSEFETGTFSGCPDSAAFATTVEGVAITLEESGEWIDKLASRQELIRVGSGDRLVAIDLSITSQHGPDEFRDCGRTLFWPEFTLEVDGFDVEPLRADLRDVEALASTSNQLIYKVPAASERIALLGGADRTELAFWELALPRETGEDGAPLIVDSGKLAPQSAPMTALRPAELTTETVSDGGPSGIVLGAHVMLTSASATNATPSSFINDRAELSDNGRTWVVADIEVTGDERTIWSLWDHQFVLVGPDGRPHVGQDLYDQSGDELVTADVDGAQRKLFRVVFETDGLVEDSEGWVLAVENGDDIPLELPMNGDQPEDPRRELASGQTGVFSYDGAGCEQSVDAEIVRALLDHEGPRSGDGFANLNVARSDPAHRSIVIDLALSGGTTDALQCTFIHSWPEFLLEVDGRVLAPIPYGFPALDDDGSLAISLHYEIPRDAQLATLSYDDQAFASWQLKDATEVLADLDAEELDTRTLVTLDETLLFGFGASSVQQGALATLTRIANVIIAESAGEVEIVGHTDSIGNDEANDALSLARAQAVADALIAAGVDADRLVVTGLGETDPVAPNNTDSGTDDPAGRAKNRRVEVFFSIRE